MSTNAYRSTLSGSSCGQPQNQIELVVRSAARRAWNEYVAHQLPGLASRNGTLISSQTPAVPVITRPAARQSRACTWASSSGSAKKPG